MSATNNRVGGRRHSNAFSDPYKSPTVMPFYEASNASTPQQRFQQPPTGGHRDSLTSEMSYFADTSPSNGLYLNDALLPHTEDSELASTASAGGVAHHSSNTTQQHSTSLRHGEKKLAVHRRFEPFEEQQYPFGDPNHAHVLRSVSDGMRTTTPRSKFSQHQHRPSHLEMNASHRQWSSPLHNTSGIVGVGGEPSGPSTFHAHNLHETIKCRTIDVGANSSPFGSQRNSIQLSRQATNTSLAALSPIPVNRNVQSNTSRSMHDFDAYVFSPDEKVKPSTSKTSTSGAYAVNNNINNTSVSLSHPGGVSRTVSGKSTSTYHVAQPKLRADQWGVTTDTPTSTDARKCDVVDISNPHPFVPHSYYSSSYTGIKHREKLFLTTHMVAEELEEATNGGGGSRHNSGSSFHRQHHDNEGSPIADRQARVLLRQRSEQERYTTAKDAPRKISTVYFDGQLQYLMEVDRQRRRQQRAERRQKRHIFKEARRRELTTAALGVYGEDDTSHVDVTLSPLSGNNEGNHRGAPGSISGEDDSLSDSSSSDRTFSTASYYHAANDDSSKNRMDGRLKKRGSGGGGLVGSGAGGDGGFYELLVPQDEADRHKAAQEAAIKDEKRRLFQKQVDGASREAAERDARIRLLETVERGDDVSTLLEENTPHQRPRTNNNKYTEAPNLGGGGATSNLKGTTSNQELLSQKQRSAHVLDALDIAYERDASLLYGPVMVATTQLTGLGLHQTHSSGALTDAAHLESAKTCGVMYPSLNMSCDPQWSSISTGVIMSLNDRYKRGELGGAAVVVAPPPTTSQTKVVMVASSQSSSPADRSPRTKSIDAGSEEFTTKKEGKSVRVTIGPVEGNIPTGVVDVSGGDDGHGLRRKQTQSDLKRKPSMGNMLSRTAQTRAKADAAMMALHSSSSVAAANNNNNPHEPSFITVSLPAEKVGEEDRHAPIEIPDSTYAAEAIADSFIREHNLNVETVRKPLIEFLLHASTNDIISRAEAKGNKKAGSENARSGSASAGGRAGGVKPKRTASLVPRCALLPNPKVQHLEAQREKAIEEAKQVVKKISIVSAGSKKIIEQILAREEQDKAFYTTDDKQPHSLHRRASLALPAHLRLHPQGQEDALQEYYEKHGHLPSSKRGSSSGAGTGRRPSSAPRIAGQSPGSRLHAQAKDRQDRLAIKSREASVQRSKAEMRGVTLKPKITPAGRSAAPKYSQPRGSQEPADVVSEESKVAESELSATQRRQVVIADVTFGEIQVDESDDDSTSNGGGTDITSKMADSQPPGEVSPVARRPRKNAVFRAAPQPLLTSQVVRAAPSEEQLPPAPRSPIVTRNRGNAIKGTPRPRSSTATFSDANRPVVVPAVPSEYHQDAGSRLYNQRDSAKERRDSLRAYHENVDPATGQKLFRPNLAPR